MAKQHLLLVAQDAQALRLMEVSLRQAGFTTTTATDGVEAMGRLEALRPALVIADAEMPAMDGYDLCVHLKTDPRYAEIPFILLADEGSADARIRGLELGADDALTRPIYTRELITRVRMALEREKRRSLSSQHRFFGDLADMSVIDLLQTVEIGGKSGRARITSDGRQGTLWFDGGQVADADAGGLTGEDAVYRMLTWDTGTFEMDFRGTPRARTVEASTPALLMEGVRRMDEWSRVAEQLPGLELALRVDDAELAEHDLTPPARELLRLFDGHRSIRAVVDAAPLPDLEAIRLIARLYLEGVLAAPGRPAVRGLAVVADDGIDLLEPDWMEEPDLRADLGRAASNPVRAQAAPPADDTPTRKIPTPHPASEPPPRVTGSVVPVAGRRPRGLVDDLIRAAANLPAAEAVVAPPSPELPATRRQRPVPPSALRASLASAEAVPAEPTPPRAPTPRLEPVAPEPPTLERRREPTPMLAPRGPEGPTEATVPRILLQTAERPVEAPARPAPPPPERDPGVEVRSAERLPAPPPPARQGPEFEEDLLTARGHSRAIGLTVVLVALIAAGAIIWLTRDEVTPFAGRVDGPRIGWHKSVLQARPPVTAQIPAALPAAVATVAPAEAAAPPSEAPATTAAPPSEAAPASVAPAVVAPDSGGAPVAEPAPPTADPFDKALAAGRADSKQGRYAQAARHLAAAVKLRPEHVEARLALAKAHLEAGSDDAALAEAQQVIQRKAGAADAWLIAGTVHQLKGRKAEAAQAYQRYLDLAPSGASAGELRNILPSLTSP